MRIPKRNAGANALRRGRFSTSRANYFVTICVDPRLPVLTDTAATSVLHHAQAMDSDASWTLRCATIMPDHAHLFFTLGERLTRSQSIARLKSRTRALFPAPVRWQDNFYDHQLRPADSTAAIVRYIYQNPYRAHLLPASDNWPFFLCRPEDWSWFEPLTDSAQPFPEWLR